HNMRGYFSRQTDGREIADDIEARVAELMSELRSSGVNAINIEHVEEIIRRVGNPEQLDNDFDAAEQQKNRSQPQESATSQEAPRPSQANRRLFRDIRHALLGGVLAGFSVYTGISTTMLRIIVCIITLFMLFIPDAPVFLIPVALYLICWIAIPAAKTPAERLEMKGAPINMATLQEEFLKTTRNISGSIPANAAHRLARGILTLLKGLAALAVTILIATCAIALIATIGVIILAFSVPEQDFPIIFGDYSLVNITYNAASRLQIWTLMTSLMLSLGLTLFLGVRLLMQFAGKANPMGRGWRWGCIIVWLISLGTLTGSWASVIAQSVRYERDIRKE
ncbi:MAG: PspC domain-containing protein, partial [Muribaculaceae bacterium]|nr:PspC domain-containing protein [Muribaculaceae bacterium]